MTVEQKLAGHIIKKLRQKGVHVLRCDSRSSKSIYLKFDFGVAFGLRISDHASRKHHLNYRYNLLTNNTHNKWDFAYSPGNLNKLIYRILDNRKNKINKLGRKQYRSYMKKLSRNVGNSKSGFWKFCQEVK